MDLVRNPTKKFSGLIKPPPFLRNFFQTGRGGFLLSNRRQFYFLTSIRFLCVSSKTICFEFWRGSFCTPLQQILVTHFKRKSSHTKIFETQHSCTKILFEVGQIFTTLKICKCQTVALLPCFAGAVVQISKNFSLTKIGI